MVELLLSYGTVFFSPFLSQQNNISWLISHRNHQPNKALGTIGNFSSTGVCKVVLKKAPLARSLLRLMLDASGLLTTRTGGALRRARRTAVVITIYLD